MQRIKIKASQNYEVVIGKDLLPKIGAEIKKVVAPCKAGIITDNKVGARYLETVKASLLKEGYVVFTYIIKSGEKSKTAENFIKIQNYLADNEFSRTDMLVIMLALSSS